VCIWLVVLFEDLKMHRTTNHKKVLIHLPHLKIEEHVDSFLHFQKKFGVQSLLGFLTNMIAANLKKTINKCLALHWCNRA
jgi:hypothetical protein